MKLKAKLLVEPDALRALPIAYCAECVIFAEVKADGNLTLPVTRQALSMMHIDEAGLRRGRSLSPGCHHRKIQGGPVGLNTISAATAQELETIEEVIEPFLLQLGFLQRTPRGRLATPKAYQHLGL